MKFRLVVAVPIMVQGLALLGLSAAHANVILSYTGQDFTNYTTPYTDTDNVTATITLAQPLGDNLSFSPVTPIAFSLNDGVQTISSTQAISSSTFEFSTDATGAITAWDVAADILVSHTQAAAMSTFSEPNNAQTSDHAEIPSGSAARNVGLSGMWTETNVAVPAPPLSNLAALGVLGLAFFWRRRRQILDLVRYSTQP